MKGGKWSLSTLEKRLSLLEKRLQVGVKFVVHFAGSEPDLSKYEENGEEIIKIRLYWPDVRLKPYDNIEEVDNKQ